jgi:hypothetical protein
MRRLQGAESEEYQLEVGECDCGYHFGVDATFLEQVEDFAFVCPSCGITIHTAEVFPEDSGPVNTIFREECCRDDPGLQRQNAAARVIGEQVLRLCKRTVTCKLCHQEVPSHTAHLHQDGWVGDCCWDERLRSTE